MLSPHHILKEKPDDSPWYIVNCSRWGNLPNSIKNKTADKPKLGLDTATKGLIKFNTHGKLDEDTINLRK
jgi:hypothetical protein